jgi:MinD superfamily P-loop ATPase
MPTDFVIILVTEAEMIAIVEERLIAATIEKIAIEAVMIVNAMDRILAARGAIEDFGEKRLPRKNRPYHQQGWTSRWSVQPVDAIRSRS